MSDSAQALTSTSVGAGTAPSSLWRAAGLLALIGAGLRLVDVVSLSVILQAGAGTFLTTLLLSLPCLGLAVTGGFYALMGRYRTAAWIIVAASGVSVLLGLVLIPISDGGFQLWIPWPWTPLATLGDTIAYFGLVQGVIVNVTWYWWWLLLAAAVLAVVAFVRTPPQLRSRPRPVAKAAAVVVAAPDGSVAAGWYQDPDGKPSERYWDGQSWTEQTRPLTSSTLMAGVLAKPTVTPTGEPISDKSRGAAAAICFFVGALGIHRFYVGKVGTGVAMLLTLGGLGIWALIDFIWILMGTFRDIDGKLLANW